MEEALERFFVSIPVRVLGVLEPVIILNLFRRDRLVSIPVRVLGVLEHPLKNRVKFNLSFQSL